MKITKSQLKQIIKEEISKVLSESSYRQHRGGVYGTGDTSSMETEQPAGEAAAESLAAKIKGKLDSMGRQWAWPMIDAEMPMALQSYTMEDLRDLYDKELKGMVLPSLEEMGL